MSRRPISLVACILIILAACAVVLGSPVWIATPLTWCVHPGSCTGLQQVAPGIILGALVLAPMLALAALIYFRIGQYRNSLICSVGLPTAYLLLVACVVP